MLLLKLLHGKIDTGYGNKKAFSLSQNTDRQTKEEYSGVWYSSLQQEFPRGNIICLASSPLAQGESRDKHLREACGSGKANSILSLSLSAEARYLPNTP